MSDPAVSCFLTKTLCAQGGRLGLRELGQRISLSERQLRETLAAAGSERFLVLRDGAGEGVLALAAVRVCGRSECRDCGRLHLCRLNLMGRCNLRVRPCKYSHDIISVENRKVLKAHGLSGLDENELRVLLLQNDPFFLPDVCQFYNGRNDTCRQKTNCHNLHVCRHFLQGQCRFIPCKKSHNLLDSHSLRILETEGIDVNIASNIQAIYSHKHVEFNKELKKSMGKLTNLLKNPACIRYKEPRTHLQTVQTMYMPPPDGKYLYEYQLLSCPTSNVPDQSQDQLPTDAGGKDQDKKDDSSTEDLKEDKEGNCDEICLFYVWKYCKHGDKCRLVHYHLPYRWQIHNGVSWNDLAMMEEIEEDYCDPKNNSTANINIDFQTMTRGSFSVRRLSTPSSVTKPTFLLTTQWIWYWKNDQDQWIEYGEQGEGVSAKSPSSAVIENLYLADPDATVPFQAGLHHYELNFKEMTQTNTSYKTQRQVCRRPKFVSSEDVQKIKKGQRDSSIPNQACPTHWDQSVLPDLGYKAVEISNTTSEYDKIKQMFHQTMKTYSVLTIKRVQNPSLWKVFQWQKDHMKRENGGKEVNEKLLFYGTNRSFMETICIHNLDWRTCGSNGDNYGHGIYFSRDASYSHAYCQPAVKTYIMFLARVLVGDYVKGRTTYVRPPAKYTHGLQFYDSCVDDELNPSIFVIFDKNQIYPEYIIEYKE
ncbi:PAR12 polymerase, partial [Centropus unirufus]|nr:PAR12 polymerase [Centropus unirufus]